VTNQELGLFAKKVAEGEIKRAQEDRRVSGIITRATKTGMLDASLRKALKNIDTDGDGASHPSRSGQSLKALLF